MRIFIWVVVILFTLEVIGAATLLWKNKMQRDPASMVLGTALSIILIFWAAWLLGSGEGR
jgi:hypothetical protein